MANHHLHPATALKVSPKSLTIEEGESGVATISGGKAPYTAELTTGENITPAIGLDGVTLTVTTTALSSATGVVTITDDDEDTVTLNITVTEPVEEQTEERGG